MHTPEPITTVLRAAVNRYGGTREQLSNAAGIDPASLSRFMAGKSITLRSADALARVLGLRLVQDTTRKGDIK